MLILYTVSIAEFIGWKILFQKSSSNTAQFLHLLSSWYETRDV